MGGSRARFVSGPGLGMDRKTPVRPPAKPRPRRAATTLRRMAATTTLRPTRAADLISGETEELHDHRPAGAPDPGQPSQRARPGDHSDVQRAGEPAGYPPAAEGRVPECA